MGKRNNNVVDLNKEAADAASTPIADQQPPIRVEEFPDFNIGYVKLPEAEPDAPPLDEEAIKTLEKSIGQGIQLHPIVINSQNVLLCGRHRYEACLRLKRATISAKRVTCTPKQEADIITQENTVRRKLSLQEKMFQINKFLAPYVRPAGHQDSNSLNLDYLYNDLGEAAVEAGYFGSRAAYFQGKNIVEKCIPDVIKAYDKDEISLYRAFKFASTKPTRQASLLTRMMDKRKDDADKPTSQNMTAAQKTHTTADVAAQYDFPGRMDKYEVIHVAPDWHAPNVLKKTKRLPVGKFICPDAAVFLDCPASMIDLAIEVFDHWKIHYMGFFTVDSRNAISLPLSYVSREQLCVVIGTADKDCPLETNGDKRIEPHYVADDPRDAVVRILTDYFGVKGYMRGCMLDMTSTVPIEGWDVLELKFRKNTNAV